ncbi:MAG: hypothetical protein AB1746_17125 [Candidatus Zixiibacteriota bacterium]
MDDLKKNIDLISGYLNSELKKKDREKVEKLLNSSEEFRNMYEMIKTLSEQGNPGHLNDLVPSLKQMSLNMFRQYNNTDKRDRQLLGLPVYDSRTIPLPEGVRPSLTSARRMRYKFDSMEVEISLNPMTLYSFEIIGQIDDESHKKNYSVELTAGARKFTAETDELGMFTFSRVPILKYRLNILAERKIIGMIDIDLC